jgi:Uma2 family endonuclease
MTVTAPPDLLTYEQWRELPESNLPQEVIDGILHVSPAPRSEHQRASQNISDEISPFVRRHGLGVLLQAPVDVVIRRSPLRTRQPDLLFLSAARSGIRSMRELREMPALEVTPDLVIEVLSGSDSRAALEGKLRDYARIGVPECWLVSVTGATVEVLSLLDGGYHRTALLGIGDHIETNGIPGWTCPVSRFFE